MLSNFVYTFYNDLSLEFVHVYFKYLCVLWLEDDNDNDHNDHNGYGYDDYFLACLLSCRLDCLLA